MAKTSYNNSKDRRVFERFKVKLPARFINLKRNKEGTAHACDVCAKGLGLVAQEKVAPFTPMEVWLDVPDRGEPFYARGEVVWAKPGASNNWRLGINLERADLMGIARILRAA